MTRLPPDFPGQAIAPQLDPDEKVIWCGRPRQGVFFRAADVINIPLSVLWTGLTIMLVDQARTQNRLDFFVTVIALSALYWLIGRFFLGAWQRSKTYYVATDRRVVVASALVFGGVRSLKWKDLYTFRLSLALRKRGTISFGAAGYAPSRIGLQNPNVLAFDNIEHAADVYELIRPHVPDSDRRPSAFIGGL